MNQWSSVSSEAARLLLPKRQPGEDCQLLLKWEDVFISVPAESGTHLCYFLMPLAFDAIHRKGQFVLTVSSIVVVVSPLGISDGSG